jgi:hypothetical protein
MAPALLFFMPTPLKVGGHIAFAFTGIPEFRFTTSSLPFYNSVKFDSTALVKDLACGHF